MSSILKSSAKRRHVSMACISCRESKVKVTIFPSLQFSGGQIDDSSVVLKLTSHSVMAEIQPAPTARIKTVSVATRLLTNGSKRRTFSEIAVSRPGFCTSCDG